MNPKILKLQELENRAVELNKQLLIIGWEWELINNELKDNHKQAWNDYCMINGFYEGYDFDDVLRSPKNQPINED